MGRISVCKEVNNSAKESDIDSLRFYRIVFHSYFDVGIWLLLGANRQQSTNILYVAVIKIRDLRRKWKEGYPVLFSREEALPTALQQIEHLEDAFRMYKEDCGTYPSTEQGLLTLLVPPQDGSSKDLWKGPYIYGAKLPLDSWGNEFYYRIKEVSESGTSSTTPVVGSSGPDGIIGTPDDIER